MFERMGYAFRMFFKLLFNGDYARKVRKALARNMDALEEHHRCEERGKGAVRVLAVLQRDGRLIDFLREDITGYSDEQVGSAVRNIHSGCKKAIEKILALEPVMDKDEGAQVTVGDDFDASSVRLVGDVTGKPPFKGALRHRGWRAATIDLPAVAEGQNVNVLAPAEVEVGAA
jgi:hypothetical protein